MKKVWIDSKKVSELIKVDRSLVQKKIKAGNTDFVYRYVDARGRGGKKIEILLSSLPLDAQARYKNLEPLLPDISSLNDCSGKQRTAADNKYWTVELYQKSSMKVDEFIEWYNREYDSKISRPQLFRWQKKLKEGGPAALVDRRGEHRRGKTSIPDDAWDYFYSLYMTQQKRGVQLCYDWTKKEFPDIPSVFAFHRKVKKIPEYALIRYREGEHALQDNLPSIDRDKKDICSNEIWFSDHHRIDVFTQNGNGTKICRMWLTLFFDARSNKVISRICREADPSAAVVKQALKNGIWDHGIPGGVYFDNGADYRSKHFSQDFPLSIVRQLGIGNIYATPYHGQAKTVERFFRTLEERFGKMFPTYTGKDAKNRPEQMQAANEKMLAFAVSKEKFLQCLDNYIEDYNNTPSRGKDMEGKSPDEIYYQNLPVKREVADRRALAILCGNFETRTVHKNGITLMHREYQNEKLLPYFKRKVIVNYDPENIDELNVFDEEMRSICVAVARIRTPFRHTTEEDYKRAQKEKKRARQFVEKYRPQMEQDTISLIAKNQLSEQTKRDSVFSPVAVEQVPPGFDMEAFGKKRSHRDACMDEPDIQDILLNRYREEDKRKTGGF